MEKTTINTVCDDALGDLDATSLLECLRKGEISPLELVQAAITRAETANPILNAIVSPTFETALEQAKNASTGGLAGLPTFIKDNVQVKGVPTRFGSRGVPDRPSKHDHPFVKQFKSLGMISLGRTALPEFGLPPTTESLLHGATANPWNTDYSTGGSSGGSSAMVVSGVVPIAHGNDGGGSIRIPAACCGLVGLKPSRGRLVTDPGLEKLPINVVHEGVLTRSIRDTALFMAEAEKYFSNPHLPRLGMIESPGNKRLRIAVVTEAVGGVKVDEEVIGVIQSVAKLCQDMGHQTEGLSIPFSDQIRDDFIMYYGFMFCLLHRLGRFLVAPGYDPSKIENLTLGMGNHFLKHIFSFPGAVRRLKRADRVTKAVFANYDVILNPVLASPPVKNGTLIDHGLPFEEAFQKTKDFAPFTALQNITGEPAISLPLGMSKEGLPIGVQFAAPLGQDKVLLELAYELEQAKPWPHFPDKTDTLGPMLPKASPDAAIGIQGSAL